MLNCKGSAYPAFCLPDEADEAGPRIADDGRCDVAFFPSTLAWLPPWSAAEKAAGLYEKVCVVLSPSSVVCGCTSVSNRVGAPAARLQLRWTYAAAGTAVATGLVTCGC